MALVGKNLLDGPGAHLPGGRTPADRALRRGGRSRGSRRRAFPKEQLPWAILAEEALADGRTLEGYAYARVGYRGLDALRGRGWKGHGPVLYSHEPNRGFYEHSLRWARLPRRSANGRAARIESSWMTPIREAAGQIAQRLLQWNDRVNIRAEIHTRISASNLTAQERSETGLRSATLCPEYFGPRAYA